MQTKKEATRFVYGNASYRNTIIAKIAANTIR